MKTCVAVYIYNEDTVEKLHIAMKKYKWFKKKVALKWQGLTKTSI